MKVKTFIFSDVSSKKIDETINNFIKNKHVISISLGVSSGTILGGGGIIYTILYNDK